MSAPAVPRPKTRKPTGKASWPLILLAGEAKTGKTYQFAQATADPRMGQAYLLDLGEGSGDEYINVPGADYELIDHDGTWIDIIAQVEAVRDFARAELEAGRKPVLLGVDSMTMEWAMLSEWAYKRARRSRGNLRLLAEDPDAEIDITSNFWNDATSRHNQLMNILKTFPGIVVMIALETEKTQFGPGGRPLPNAPKVAKPDGQKRLGADSTAWIRLSLTEEPVVVGMRSLKRSTIPGKDRPEPWPGFNIPELVFDFLGLGGDTAQVRNTPALDADQQMPNEVPDDPEGDERRPAQNGQGRPANRGAQRPQGVPNRPAADAAPPGDGEQAPPADTPEKLYKRAGAAVNGLLDAGDFTRVLAVIDGIEKRAAGELDASAHLTETDRENLGLQPDETVTVDEVSAYVTAYWKRHKVGPRAPVEPPPETGEAAAESERGAA